MTATDIPKMDSSEFSLWQSLLEKRTGLWLPETRKAFLLTSLRPHMKAKGIATYSELYKLLETGLISTLDWANLVDSLTVHETCFYRDKDSLNLVSSYFRNKVLIEDKQVGIDQPHYQIWSVGCSTGEEAYTLALEMEKLKYSLEQSENRSFYYGVTGVDVSYPSLAVAREGIYAKQKSNLIPSTSMNSHFEQLADDHIKVSESIRKRTCFIQGNILEVSEQPSLYFDLVYCQNVLIYFRQEKKEKIVNDLAKHLKPGGLLVLAPGELTKINNAQLTRVENKHCLAYMKSKNNIVELS